MHKNKYKPTPKYLYQKQNKIIAKTKWKWYIFWKYGEERIGVPGNDSNRSQWYSTEIQTGLNSG
jgi:hypothetical protein